MKAKKGGKRRKETGESLAAPAEEVIAAAQAPRKQQNWGLLEPLRGPLEPIVDLISPAVAISVLSVLVIFLLLRQSRLSSYGSTGLGYPGMHSPQRLAAYEQMWAGEEADSWAWLEERIGLQGASPALFEEEKLTKQRQKQQRAREMAHKIKDKEMSERQILEAIKATRERLEALEEAVQRRGGKSQEHIEQQPL
jgi:hypothetical protein